MKRIKKVTTTNTEITVLLQSLTKEIQVLKNENQLLKKSKPISTMEVQEDGLLKLLGEQVQLWCLNYIYAGKLIEVNKEDVVLEDAVVVYETGNMKDKQFKLAESTADKELFIRTAAIESYSLAPQMIKF